MPLVAGEGAVAEVQGEEEEEDTVATRQSMLQPHPSRTLGSSQP